jgi:hypothetical protein
VALAGVLGLLLLLLAYFAYFCVKRVKGNHSHDTPHRTSRYLKPDH